MNLDKRELGTVLAALRAWQGGQHLDQDLLAIASDEGTMHRLTDEEIDTLAERLNGPGDMRPFFFDASLNNARAAAQMCLTKLHEAHDYAGPVESLLLAPAIESVASLETLLGMTLEATRSAA
jgi:hypothetical protein